MRHPSVTMSPYGDYDRYDHGDEKDYGKDYGTKVVDREVISVSSSSSLGWKPIRKRGVPRPPGPNFFKSPGRWFKHELWSWRFYVWIYAALAGAVVIINMVVLIAVAVKRPFDTNGRSTLFEGSCQTVKNTNRYAHWFFSVFGTGYLSASAYVMVNLPVLVPIVSSNQCSSA